MALYQRWQKQAIEKYIKIRRVLLLSTGPQSGSMGKELYAIPMSYIW